MINETQMLNAQWVCLADEGLWHWGLVIPSSLWFRNSSLDLSSRGPAFSHKPHYAGPRAFTLIELILVMALLSIVLAVSAPALSGFFRGRTADAAARRLVSLIRYGPHDFYSTQKRFSLLPSTNLLHWSPPH
jgi:prepilin-type N-terminal cleavage/methylation domain-containing protein